MSSCQMSAADEAAIMSLPGNDKCAECGSPNPQWASVSFGTVFCLECSGAHRGLGVHISFVRSIKMDNWTPQQLAIMKAGGNDQCASYLKQKGVPSDTPLRAKYESAPAQHYKEVLKARVQGLPEPPFVVPSKLDGIDTSNAVQQPRQQRLKRAFSSTEIFFATFPIVFYLIVGKALHSRKQQLIIVLVVLIGSLLVGIGIEEMYPALQRTLQTVFLLGSGLFLLGSIVILVVCTMLSLALLRNRHEAFKSAVNLLSAQIKTGRVQRHGGDVVYDVYLPLSCSTDLFSKKKSTVQVGLLFFPGALVDITAYSPIALALSDVGILVVVVDCEPARIATVKSGASLADACAIIADVAKVGSGIRVSEWAVGGHSAGAAAAANIVKDIPGVTKLVMWGSSSNADLKGSIRDLAVDVLVVNGSNDGFLKHSKVKGNYEKFRSWLPPERGQYEGSRLKGSTVYDVIEGGNHSGYGHYGPQLFPIKDGDRTITLDEQQKRSVKSTAEFLLGKKENSKKN